MGEASFKLLIDKLLKEPQAEVRERLLNAKDLSGNTALTNVLSSGNPAKIAALLDLKPNPNLFYQMSPLQLAIDNNDTETALKLIELGAKVTEKGQRGDTPLASAAAQGNLKLIETLVEKGAIVSPQEGERALKKALLNNHPEAVIKLIELGVNPEVHLHASENNYSSIKLSSYSSGDGDNHTHHPINPGDTPLHWAILSGNEALARACLEKKPEMVNSKNDKGLTPAYFCLKTLNPQMAHLLYSFNPKIDFSLPCPNSTSYFSKSEARERTFLMAGSTRGFKSDGDIEEFFANPDYKLSDAQEARKEKKGYGKPSRGGIFAARVSTRSDQQDAVDLHVEHSSLLLVEADPAQNSETLIM